MRIDQFIMSQETVDRLGDVLLLAGLDGSILDANVAALDCYGHSHTEMLALSMHEIRSPQSQDDTDGQMREAAEHGVLFETEHRRRDGTPFPVEVWMVPVNVDAGAALLSVVRDITARKKAEEELSHAEKLFRATFEQAAVGIAHVGTDGTWLKVILMGAKMIAVADVVEAMMSHRPYRAALGVDQAIAEIERGAGRLYDADVSKACVVLFREGNFEFS